MKAVPQNIPFYIIVMYISALTILVAKASYKTIQRESDGVH